MTTLPAGSAARLDLARYGESLGRFLAWWRRSLLAWVPARARAVLGLEADRLLLSRQGDGLRLCRETAGRLGDPVLLPLPEAGLDGLLDPRVATLPRAWLLPAEAALRRPLRLPGAAAERLRDVVGFEIDRQTPFSADAVQFDARLLDRREDGQIDAELVVVPRLAVQRALQGLDALAVGLAAIDVADADGRPLGVNLLPPQQRARRRGLLRGWNLVLAGIAVLALVAAAWQVLDNRRAAADALEAKVRGEATAARAVAAQRQQLADLVEGAAFLDRTRAARPTAVEVLDEVSRRLPDGTYLEKLSMEGERLLLIGLSPEASGLVARLEGAPLWRAPALSGTLQTDARSRRDRFSLTAELAPRAAAPARPANGGGDGRTQR